MATWEYLSLLIDVTATREITYPYEINHLGTEGWELIHMQRYSDNTYFCVFKRPTDSQYAGQDTATFGVAAQQLQQLAFNVILTDPGRRKIDVIKALAQITGRSLKEANNLVASKNPTVLEGVGREAAFRVKEILEAAGATVIVK